MSSKRNHGCSSSGRNATASLKSKSRILHSLTNAFTARDTEALVALRRALVERTLEGLRFSLENGCTGNDQRRNPMNVALTKEQFPSRRPLATALNGSSRKSSKRNKAGLSSSGLAINWFWHAHHHQGEPTAVSADGVEVILSGHGTKQGSVRQRLNSGTANSATANARRERKRLRKRERQDARKSKKLKLRRAKAESDAAAAAAAAAKELRRKVYLEKARKLTEQDQREAHTRPVSKSVAVLKQFHPALPKVRSRLCRARLAQDALCLWVAVGMSGLDRATPSPSGDSGKAAASSSPREYCGNPKITYRMLKERGRVYTEHKDSFLSSPPFSGWLRTDRKAFMSFEIEKS